MALSSTTKDDLSEFLQTVSWNSLRSGTRATLHAFQLPLFENENNLLCHEIVRVIPGKRLVAFGTWKDKPIVAKLFYGSRSAARNAQRETEGIKALHHTGILSPQIYFSGKSHDKKIHVIIFERILDGYSLDDIWQAKPTLEDVSPLMHALTLEIATQHVMGILQNDLHFKNFIIKRKQVYTIDAGDLEIYDTPISKKESLDNLGLFFSQLGVGTELFRESLFAHYVKSRGWLVSKNDLLYLENAIQRWTTKRVENYARKVMRSSTAFVCIEKFKRRAFYDRYYESQELLKVLENPDVKLMNPYAEILKAGRSSTVAKITIDDKVVVLKRYNIKNIFHWLRRCLRDTRAVKSWQLAHRLRLLGIATAKPIACVEKRFLKLRSTSYLMMEEVKGIDAGTFFTKHNPNEGKGLIVAHEITNIIKNLAKLNMVHGDLKMTNILIENNKPYLIDLDGMREYKSQRLFKRAYHSEITRFMQNWQNQPEVCNVFEKLFSAE